MRVLFERGKGIQAFAEAYLTIAFFYVAVKLNRQQKELLVGHAHLIYMAQAQSIVHIVLCKH